jgi:hypothetical protein
MGMTLNITAVGPHGIHQSSDFRLTNAKSGVVLSDTSPKQVSFFYGAWSAALAYTGVGQWRGKDTCCWVVGWVTPRDNALPFEEFIELIRSEGTAWLAGMGKPTPHSFVIGAYVAHKPQVVLISNFESLHAPPSRQARAELSVSRIQPRRIRTGNPVVVITGRHDAVNRTHRRLLRAALRAQPESLRMRQLLDIVNQIAALSDSKVSPECTTCSLTPDGPGTVVEQYGDVTGNNYPHRILFGLDTVDLQRRALGAIEYIGKPHGAP